MQLKVDIEPEKVQKDTEKVLADKEISKSQKMKDLFHLGYAVNEISDMLKVRYNFVYNVISNYVTVEGITVEKSEKFGKKDQIIALWLNGSTLKAISGELKTNYNYVYNVIKTYKLENPGVQQVTVLHPKSEEEDEA
ncbi:hypothetical protein D3C76_169640 [compost metagenome]